MVGQALQSSHRNRFFYIKHQLLKRDAQPRPSFGLYLDLTEGCGGPACNWNLGSKTPSAGQQGQGQPCAIKGGTGGADQAQGPDTGRERRAEREEEEGSGKQGLRRGEGRKEPLCWPPFPHHNPQEQQQSVMQIVTPPPA